MTSRASPFSGLRVFTAVRRELEVSGAVEITMGLEWEPLGRVLGISPNASW
jgi:hypothetical protein